jgi:hypothetical protein
MNCQRFARNQTRPQLRQLPFRFRGEITIKMLGDDELKDRVPQKFQPLIIEMISVRLMAQAGVSQRFRQEQSIPKLVTDTFFERIHPKEILT